MHTYRLFTQRVILIASTNLLTVLSGIILLPILTKNMTIADYGAWAQIMATIVVVPSIVMLGLTSSIVRYIPSLEDKKQIQEAFYSISFVVLFTSLISCALIYIFSQAIASHFFNNNTIIVQILAPILFIETINILFLNYMRARQLIKKYTFILLIKNTSLLVLVSYFVISGENIYSATIGLLIATFLTLIILIFAVVSSVGFTFPNFRHIQEYLHFGVPTIPANLSNWIVNSSDLYIIGFLLSTASVGYYSPGYSLGSSISILWAPLAFILPSVLSQYYEKKQIEEVRTIMRYSLKYFLLLAIPAVFGISLLSRPILIILTTPEISSQGALITPFSAVSALVFGIYSIIIQILVLEKRTKIIGKIWIISALLNIGLNFLLIPHIGIIGAAITTLFAFVYALAATLYSSPKKFKINLEYRYLLKYIFASIIMSIIILKLNPFGITAILTTVVICAIFYFILLLALNVFEKKEILFFKGFIRQINMKKNKNSEEI